MVVGTRGGGAEVVFRFVSDLRAFRLEALHSDLMKTQALAGAVNASMQSLWNAISIGTMAIAAMGIPFMIASKGAAEFQRSMTLAANKSEDPQWKAGLDRTIDAANDIRRAWGIAGDEVSTAFLELAKSGYDLADAMELLEPIAMLTQAEVVGMADATSIANQMWILFGKEGGVTGYEMLNKVFVAAKSSRLELQDLPMALRETGAAFKMAQVSMDEYLATAGAMSQINVRLGSEMASTIYTLIGDPTKRRQMEDFLGIELMEDGILQWTRMMEAAAQFRGQEGVGEVLYDIFGMRSMKSMSQLIEGSEIYLELIGAIENAGDEMESAAQATMGTIDGLMRQMRASIETAMQSPAVIAALTAAMERLNEAVSDPMIGQAIAHYITMSAHFMEALGPELIHMVFRLIQVMNELAPLLMMTGNIFVAIASFVSKVDSGIVMLIASMIIFNKLIPTAALNMSVFSKEMAVVTFQAHGLRVGILGALSGMMMFQFGANETMKTLGLLITIFSSLTAALWAYTAAVWAKNAAKAASIALINPLAAAAAAGIAVGVGSYMISAGMRESMGALADFDMPEYNQTTNYSTDNRNITLVYHDYEGKGDVKGALDEAGVM